MSLLNKVKELKNKGLTVNEIAKQLNKPYWIIKVLYDLADKL